MLVDDGDKTADDDRQEKGRSTLSKSIKGGKQRASQKIKFRKMRRFADTMLSQRQGLRNGQHSQRSVQKGQNLATDSRRMRRVDQRIVPNKTNQEQGESKETNFFHKIYPIRS